VTCISILTDFGLKDGNVGVMKGVIWGIAPDVQILDLSHDISPQNIQEAAFVLGRSAPYFPSGTIHLVVVDPGVGTERRPMAAQIGPYQFVGPDNGVVTRLMDHATREGWSIEAVHINNPEYWLPEISHVFHGRDIFAPVAAHLATGVSLKSIGISLVDPVLLSIPLPNRIGAALQGEIIYIDRFGSLVTNIREPDFGTSGFKSIEVCDTQIVELVNTFGEHSPGSLVALFSSTGDLIISVVNGSAAEQLGGEVGDFVTINFLS
jgi:S-adenosylmethionine hydrolase